MTSLIEVGKRVVFKSEGKAVHGRVSSHDGRHYRLVDDTGSRYTTGKGPGRKVEKTSVKREPFGVFVFDTQLDSGFKSRRHSGTWWQEFCSAENWTCAVQRVHSLADLTYFLSRRTLPGQMIVFNGHGHSKTGWSLTNGECFAAHTIDKGGSLCINGSVAHECAPFQVHEGNRGKVIVFSACEIGENKALCESFKQMFSARAVIAYKTMTYDAWCYMAEGLLAFLVAQGMSPKKATEQVQASFKSLTPHMSKRLQNRLASFPLVCFE